MGGSEEEEDTTHKDSKSAKKTFYVHRLPSEKNKNKTDLKKNQRENKEKIKDKNPIKVSSKRRIHVAGGPGGVKEKLGDKRGSSHKGKKKRVIRGFWGGGEGERTGGSRVFFTHFSCPNL